MEEFDDFEHQYDSNLETLDQHNAGGAPASDEPARDASVKGPNGYPTKRKLDAVDPNKGCGRLFTVPALNSSLYAKRPRLDDEDLFGEADDNSIPERSYMTLKTNKPSEHHVISTMMKIHRARLALGTAQFDENLVAPVDDDISVSIPGEFHRKPPRGVKWISVTSPDGDLGFFKLHQDQIYCRSAVENGLTAGLLQQPFGDIQRDAEKIVETRMTAKYDPIEGSQPIARLSQTLTTESLWVDKYRPKFYTDLLSDDGINRTLLTWLKLWDECVFGIKKPTDNSTKKQPVSTGSGVKPPWKNFKQPDAEDFSTELDQYKRPQYKVALLCGLPGLGKTTLAHSIATHAKYHPVEMNASDDRSVDHFKKQLEASTQMKATLDKDSRPHCLIIDEIDGAPTPAVDFLVSFVKGEGTAKRKQIVKRPIICICNDLYVPALRELRKIALIIQFPTTEPEKLVQRLATICRKEQIRTETTILAELVERSGYDIRSCINTLQFLKAKGQKRLDMADVNDFSLGQKDSHKSLFTVWHEIFQMPRPKRNGLAGLKRDGKENPTSIGARFNNILKTVNTCEDGDKLRQGLFDNLSAVSMRDSKLTAWHFALDWFNFTEQIHSMAFGSQHFNLLGYTPFVSVIFHLLFASQDYVKIAMPSSQFECQRKLNRGEGILASMMANMSSSVRPFLNPTVLVLDVIPAFCQIVQPPIRAVSLQLYSEKEKTQLKRLISTMITYNLTYKQVRSEEGQYVYTMEPDVDLIRVFPGESSRNCRILTYSIKQMISYEIDLERVRRMAKHHEVSAPHPSTKRTVSTLKPQLKPKPIDEDENKPRLDFFGRVCQPSEQSKEAKSSRSEGEIYYRFREGYTNAIRRNIRMKDLMQ